jgi:hypothetical protein
MQCIDVLRRPTEALVSFFAANGFAPLHRSLEMVVDRLEMPEVWDDPDLLIEQ